MTKLKGTNVASGITPWDSADLYATHYAKYGNGGWHAVQTLAERDAIPSDRLEPYMAVMVQATKSLYILDENNTWYEFLGDISEDLAQEIADRIAADTTITNALNAEIARATNAETALQSNIDAEASTRERADTTLQSNIDAEEDRAVAAETTLQSNIDTEASTRASADSALQSDINDEISRATSAEDALSTAISDEVTRATTAENTLTTNLNAEITRATNAEDALDDKIDDEISRATAAENTLQDNIDAEAATRSEADTALQTAISDEESRATTAEGTISTAISDEVTRATSAENALDDKIDAEITRATTAESSLQDDITAENTRALTAEDILQDNIDAEVTRATGVEGTLSNLTTDSKTNLVSAINEVDSHADTNTSNIGTLSSLTTTDKTNLVSAINEVDSDLGNEVTRATTAEETLQTNITAEETRATGVEGALSSLTTDAKTNLVSAINEVDSHIDTHVADKSNPHEVTKAQVGLGNADNTSDLDKPISTATQSALDTKVDKTSTASQLYGTSSSSTQTTYTIDKTGITADSIPQRDTNGVLKVGTALADYDAVNKLYFNTYIGTATNTAIGNEATARSNADSALGTRIDNVVNGTTDISYDNTASGLSATTIKGAIDEIDSDVDAIEILIPSEATSSNQLADKEFVNSSIATSTANFIGTFNSVTELQSYSGTVTNNDYAFVTNSVVTDNGNDWSTFNALNSYDKSLLTNYDYAWVVNSTKFDLYRFDIVNQQWDLRVSNTTKEEVTLNDAYNRYKATVSGSTISWDFEYTLNNSSFTAVQWAAINSGANITNIAQITTNANSIGTLSSLTTTAKNNLVSAINELDNDKVEKNNAITVGTHTKITYDAKGLVTGGSDLSESDIPSLHLSKISDVTATAAELNVLDGITADTSELNILDGVTVTTSEINVLDGITSTTSELNQLHNSDVTTSDLTKLHSVTADASELNVLDGITATTTELNYTDGVTSNIQTQLDDKVVKTSGSSKVYGTDSNGSQTTYDVNSFGAVDDVTVGGESVVNNKIAVLGTMAGESSSDYTKTADLPAVNNATLTIQKNSTSIGTFTANQSTDETIDISVPTKTSDLNNDSGYITSADLPTNYVTTNTAQDISAKKTFLGEKAILFKQAADTDKLGFTLYNTSGSELGALEYRPNTISGSALINLNTSQSGTSWLGFRYWYSINIIAPKPSKGNYYIPVNVTDGTNTVTANNAGTLNISTLIPTVGNGTITINQGGTQKGTFTVNQSGDTIVNLDSGGGTVDTTLSLTSTNAVENKAISQAIVDLSANINVDAYLDLIIAGGTQDLPMVIQSSYENDLTDIIGGTYVNI